MVANTNLLNLNSMMEGEYYITFTFYKIVKKKGSVVSLQKDEKIGCLTFTCLVEPAS